MLYAFNKLRILIHIFAMIFPSYQRVKLILDQRHDSPTDTEKWLWSVFCSVSPPLLQCQTARTRVWMLDKHDTTDTPHHQHPAAQRLERFNYNDGPLRCLSCLASSYGPYVKSIKWSSPNKGNQRRRLFASFYAQQQCVSILLLRETLFFLCYPKKDDISLLQLQSTSTNRIRII